MADQVETIRRLEAQVMALEMVVRTLVTAQIAGRVTDQAASSEVPRIANVLAASLVKNVSDVFTAAMFPALTAPHEEAMRATILRCFSVSERDLQRLADAYLVGSSGPSQTAN